MIVAGTNSTLPDYQTGYAFWQAAVFVDAMCVRQGMRGWAQIRRNKWFQSPTDDFDITIESLYRPRLAGTAES